MKVSVFNKTKLKRAEIIAENFKRGNPLRDVQAIKFYGKRKSADETCH